MAVKNFQVRSFIVKLVYVAQLRDQNCVFMCLLVGYVKTQNVTGTFKIPWVSDTCAERLVSDRLHSKNLIEENEASIHYVTLHYITLRYMA